MAIVISLILSIFSVKLGRNYDTASPLNIFTTSDGQVSWPAIFNWRDNNLSQDLPLLQKYIKIYTEATRKNRKEREKKASRLLASQISLMVGIGLIGAVIVLTVFVGSPILP